MDCPALDIPTKRLKPSTGGVVSAEPHSSEHPDMYGKIGDIQGDGFLNIRHHALTVDIGTSIGGSEVPPDGHCEQLSLLQDSGEQLKEGELKMTLCELMSELEKYKDKNPFYTNALLKVSENDGVWFGEFKIDSVKYNENKHSIELCCEGKRTNFIHIHDGEN